MSDIKIDPKFLFSVDPINNELYILHREFPSCLIQVVQETPMRFVVQDLYDEMEDTSKIKDMAFVEEAKIFFRDHAQKLFNLN